MKWFFVLVIIAFIVVTFAIIASSFLEPFNSSLSLLEKESVGTSDFTAALMYITPITSWLPLIIVAAVGLGIISFFTVGYGGYSSNYDDEQDEEVIKTREEKQTYLEYVQERLNVERLLKK